MQEELKQKFILLSKVAKEKKYAQEYLGLLARRGDIGSIRIGKRWYTTWQWFEEFMECSQKKKAESAAEEKEVQFTKIEKEEIVMPVAEKVKVSASVQIKMPAKENFPVEIENKTISTEKEAIFSIPLSVPEKMKATVLENQENSAGSNSFSQAQEEKKKNSLEIKIRMPQIQNAKAFQMQPKKVAMQAGTRNSMLKRNVPVIRKTTERISQKRISAGVSRKNNFFKSELRAEKTSLPNQSIEERNRRAVPYPEIKMKKNASVFSPALFRKKEEQLISRFGMAFSFAIMLFLAVVSGYFVYSGGLMGGGTVAGAANEKNNGFFSIVSGSDSVVSNMGDKMKESFSVSNLVIEVVKEKELNKGKKEK